MSLVSRDPELHPPASLTTTPHSTSMTLPVARRDFKTTQRIDMPTGESCSSRPADAFSAVKHPCAVLCCDATPHRVQHNLDSRPRPTSTGPQHVARRDVTTTTRIDMPTGASSRSRPGDAFQVLKCASCLSGSGAALARVSHNHTTLYFHDSTCRKT